jgi:hypothetical protein
MLGTLRLHANFSNSFISIVVLKGADWFIQGLFANVTQHSHIDVGSIHLAVAVVADVSKQADGFSRHVATSLQTEIRHNWPSGTAQATDHLLIVTLNRHLPNKQK